MQLLQQRHSRLQLLRVEACQQLLQQLHCLWGCSVQGW
jgi:hypothetical protein